MAVMFLLLMSTRISNLMPLLMACVQMRVVDQSVLRLIRLRLKARWWLMTHPAYFTILPI